MKTFDRYIARQFFINLMILFVAFCALYIVLDLLINLDEFVQVGEETEGGPVAKVLAALSATFDFYGPLVILLFTYLGGLLSVAAAGFTLTSMIRHHELTALLAGGISLFRVSITFIVLCLIVNGLIFINQEVILPRLAHKLVRSQAQVSMSSRVYNDIRFIPDDNGALFTTTHFDPSKELIENLYIHEREKSEKGHRRVTRRIYAELAYWNNDLQEWNLVNATVSTSPSPEEMQAGQVRNIEPIDSYKTNMDPKTLVSIRNATFRGLLGLQDLTNLLNNEKMVDVREIARIIHTRFALLALNLLVMLMGLHYFLIRTPKNMLTQSIKALITCVGAWAGGFLMMQGGMLPLDAITQVWVPIAMNIPVAYYLYATIET